MEYTTRLGDRPTLAHVNYQCPCGCVAGLTFDRHAGAEHMGRCCCGRLLWVGADAEARVRAAHESGVAYEMAVDNITLPWGDEVKAALAVPALLLHPRRNESSPRTRVLDVVCKMRIDPATAAESSVFKGETFYFCAPICKERFDADPLQFVAREA